jgi:hypothetical protein
MVRTLTDAAAPLAAASNRWGGRTARTWDHVTPGRVKTTTLEHRAS